MCAAKKHREKQGAAKKPLDSMVLARARLDRAEALATNAPTPEAMFALKQIMLWIRFRIIGHSELSEMAIAADAFEKCGFSDEYDE